jgi:hypothetical protein
MEVLGPRLAEMDAETCARAGKAALDTLFTAANL